MTGIDLIAAERKRQVEVEGWTTKHDDEHDRGELASAARIYALPPEKRQLTQRHCDSDDNGGRDSVWFTPEGWPIVWREYWKPTPDDRIRELVKAGALYQAEKERIDREIERVVAEIDRLQHLESPMTKTQAIQTLKWCGLHDNAFNFIREVKTDEERLAVLVLINTHVAELRNNGVVYIPDLNKPEG